MNLIFELHNIATGASYLLTLNNRPVATIFATKTMVYTGFDVSNNGKLHSHYEPNFLLNPTDNLPQIPHRSYDTPVAAMKAYRDHIANELIFSPGLIREFLHTTKRYNVIS